MKDKILLSKCIKIIYLILNIINYKKTNNKNN